MLEAENTKFTKTTNELSSPIQSDYSYCHLNGTQGDGDDDDACCYIVSATCKNLKLMKEYHRTVIMIGSMRNRFLKLHPEMREMIDSYYTFAPEVIEKIDASGNAKEIYQYLWSHFITPIVNLMHKRDYVKAMVLYIQMVYQQYKKYHIACPERIMEEAENYLGSKVPTASGLEQA